MTERYYNHDIKMEYLETIENEDVRDVVSHLFMKSKSTEMLYEKDLYSFNLQQIEEVMKNINPATRNSVRNNKSRIRLYIVWAIQNGRRVNNINPLAGVTSEWEDRFLDTTTERYLSSSDIHDLIDSLFNAQDKALIQCIFEGITGRAMSELLSLNVKNINWDKNIVKVKDAKTNEYRSVKVSDRCLRLIQSAYEEKTYLAEDTETEKDLIDFEGNVFKNTVWKNTKNREVSLGTLRKRLYIIKEKYGLDALSVQTICESGRIKMAADLYKERNKLETDEFKEIATHYNIPNIRVGGYYYPDTSKMKHYINSKNLKELYDLDIEL